jgi:hypothetical protein
MAWCRLPGSFLIAVLVLSGSTAAAQTYPSVLKYRYEALDPTLGGHFIVWLEREKHWYGLDKRLYPAARSVEVSHITPAPGSPPVTVIEVVPVNNGHPEYFHIAGFARFRLTGMAAKPTAP